MKKCKECDNPVRTVKNTYCSFACRNKYIGRLVKERGSLRGPKHHKWVDGSHPDYFRRRAKELYGTCCDQCGKDGASVHHIDGNKRNNPHDGSNWRMLCHKCHNELHGSLIRDELGRLLPRKDVEKAIMRPFSYPC